MSSSLSAVGAAGAASGMSPGRSGLHTAPSSHGKIAPFPERGTNGTASAAVVTVVSSVSAPLVCCVAKMLFAEVSVEVQPAELAGG